MRVLKEKALCSARAAKLFAVVAKDKRTGGFMKWLKKHFTNILLSLIFLFGVGLLLYQSFSDYYNSLHQSHAISRYAEDISNMNQEEYDRLLSDAQAYNRELARSGLRLSLSEDEIETYQKLLDVGGIGMMGYIEIPAIKCSLPIYHGVEEEILQTSIGHIPGTSLPVGGSTSHCVLSGHRGLPSAKLFTDLDKLVEGDIFLIRVLDEVMTYEVDQIRIVLPSDLSDIQIEEGQDYCTLVTCTPYGINTHRLLVRGHRIDNIEQTKQLKVTAEAFLIDRKLVATIIAIPMLLILIILVLFSDKRKTSGKKGEYDEK